MMWQYKLSLGFSAIHSIRGIGGPDAVPHGHDFSVVICFSCENLMASIDIGVMGRDLVRIGNRVCGDFLHVDLNETPPFDTYNPSLEMLARYIFEKTSEYLKPLGSSFGVAWVEISEGSSNPVVVRFVPE